MVSQGSTCLGLLKGSQAVSRQLPPAIREEIRVILRDVNYNLPRNDGCASLRRELGNSIGQSPDNILVFGSSSDPFRDLALSMKGAKVLMPWGCGGAAEVFASLGFDVISVPLTYDGEFSFPIESFLDEWSSARPDVVYLDIPNDPTGISLSREDLIMLSLFCGNSLWLIDQRYAEFSSQDELDLKYLLDRWQGKRGLGIIRSLSFAWGLGAMDISYMVWDHRGGGAVKFPSSNKIESPRGEILTHLIRRCYGWMESRTYSCRYIRDEFAKGCSKIPGIEVYQGDGPFVLLGFNSQVWSQVADLFTQRDWTIPIEVPNINSPFVQVFATSEEALSSLLKDILLVAGDHHVETEEGVKAAIA